MSCWGMFTGLICTVFWGILPIIQSAPGPSNKNVLMSLLIGSALLPLIKLLPYTWQVWKRSRKPATLVFSYSVNGCHQWTASLMHFKHLSTANERSLKVLEKKIRTRARKEQKVIFADISDIKVIRK